MGPTFISEPPDGDLWPRHVRGSRAGDCAEFFIDHTHSFFTQNFDAFSPLFLACVLCFAQLYAKTPKPGSVEFRVTVLLQCVPREVAGPVTQTPLSQLSLALGAHFMANLAICGTDLAIGAPHVRKCWPLSLVVRSHQGVRQGVRLLEETNTDFSAFLAQVCGSCFAPSCALKNR